MRFLIGIGVLAMASICVPAALADVSYDINFGGGTDGTTGSFSYNSTTATFSSFTINWDAYTFGIADFLANESPNSPQLYLDPVATAVCGSSTPAADLFAVLTGLCSIS